MSRLFVFAGVLITLLAALLGPVYAQHDFHTFHGAKGEAKLDYETLAAAAVPLEESDEGKALLEKCLTRYGGQEALEKVKGLRLTYRMKSFGPDSVDVVKTFEHPRRHRIRRPEQTRILDGAHAWFRTETNEMELDSGRYRAELFSCLTMAMPLAIRTERFDDIRFGAREEDPLRYFYLDKADSLMVVVGVDPDEGLIRSTEGAVRQGEQTFVFINRFSDYRDVEGIPFAYHVTTVSMGLEVGQSRLDRVEINPRFDDDEFSP